VSGDISRKVFGTSRQPRLGSTLSIVVLGALAVLFLLLSWWVLFALFAVLAGVAVLVRGVRTSTGR